ncbi:MAG: hypothetical protein HY606_12470, partial [Planctomycetes bacterium]|nr:hypothetical protein [Planctomycetota bacterium]
MKIQQSQDHRLVQRQELRLTHQLIQRLELLQLPSMELEQLINQELEQNPILEQQENTADEEMAKSLNENNKDNKEDPVSDILDKLEDKYDPGFKSNVKGLSEKSDKHQEAIQNAPDESLTLQDHLNDQLSLIDLPAETQKICEFLIENIEDDGYLKNSIEEITEQMRKDTLLLPLAKEELANKVEFILTNIIQNFDPSGVGARNLKECLLLQVKEDDTY